MLSIIKTTAQPRCITPYLAWNCQTALATNCSKREWKRLFIVSTPLAVMSRIYLILFLFSISYTHAHTAMEGLCFWHFQLGGKYASRILNISYRSGFIFPSSSVASNRKNWTQLPSVLFLKTTSLKIDELKYIRLTLGCKVNYEKKSEKRKGQRQNGWAEAVMVGRGGNGGQEQVVVGKGGN